jgi:hypothetical protein
MSTPHTVPDPDGSEPNRRTPFGGFSSKLTYDVYTWLSREDKRHWVVDAGSALLHAGGDVDAATSTFEWYLVNEVRKSSPYTLGKSLFGELIADAMSRVAWTEVSRRFIERAASSAANKS